MRKTLMYFISLLIFSCASDEVEKRVAEPSELIINILQNQQDAGLIGLNVSAQNTEYYSINFGAGEGFEEGEEKSYTYRYETSGEYTITVRAHASDELFIQETETVTIDIPNNEISDQGYSTPNTYNGYNLIWSDEFERTALGNDWTFEIGTGNSGWGNNELQYYKEENTELIDGYLVITAKEENSNGREYTSSRIITEDNQEFQFGRIDIRAILPTGQGIWPALWMLGSNFRDVGWPSCGEIDIMEKIGGGVNDKEVFGTLHWDINGDYACTCGQGDHYQLSEGDFGDQFHVFSLLWDENEIQWLVDDNLYHTIDISPSHMDEFRDKFFFIFNIAVGGNLPGSPDASTVFPQKMVVDYVRVFQPQ